MSSYIKAYEYESNVNPNLTNIPITTRNIENCNYGINYVDFSELYNVSYNATTPNLLASFIKLKKNEELTFQMNGSSNFFYIMQGKCEIILDNEIFTVMKNDIFIFPCFNSIIIKNFDEEELNIYYVNDSPLINYLGSKTVNKLFKAVIYSSNFLLDNLNELSYSENNRKGILLSNLDTEKIGTNTITPVLWSLYNELPPQTVQKAHKHNSVALDLCINCTDSDNIYTLIGEEINVNGNIINPKKINWKKGEMFITPPGLWHSHNNIGNTYAYILPIQDAGLLLYQRILGIKLYK
jgi:gentisate 1,2-dioxygenase